MLHVGTNDVGYLKTAQFVRDYKILANVVKSKFGGPKVLASSVLPRAKDFQFTAVQVAAFNKGIQHLVATKQIDSFCKSYRKFLSCGQVLRELYKDDGLHLNPNGSTLLARALDGRIANARNLLR